MEINAVEESGRTNCEVSSGVLLRSFMNETRRHILFSIVENEKSTREISEEIHVPVSTCYELIRELLSNRLIRVERIQFDPLHGKIAYYKATHKGISVELGPRCLRVQAFLQQ